MPLPKTKDVSRLVRFLTREHPEWEHDKVVAIAFKKAGKSKKREK